MSSVCASTCISEAQKRMSITRASRRSGSTSAITTIRRWSCIIRFAAQGLVLGNEAPGVLKRTATYLDDGSTAIGLTHKDHVYAFRKWLRPGETWESPWTFICPYRDCTSVEKLLSGPVADYLRRHLGLRVAELKDKPQFAFNTWYPQHEHISESLVLQMAEAAAECGIKDFQIDSGWHCNEFSPPNEPYWSAVGDYLTDQQKFPRGIKPVFDRVRELGMHPGLWMSLGSVGESSRVYREHPEWVVRSREGKPTYLSGDPAQFKTAFTACLSTGWYDHIKAAMLKQIKENDLKYLKIDLGVVTGVYRMDEANSGCFATNHLHKDREESLWMNYQRAWQLFDELHAAAPDLYIDCTFETMGRYQLIDLGMCRHADGNWVFNCYDDPPLGCLRQRNLSWLISPVIPPPAALVGCVSMDRPQVDLIVGSLAGTFPIMLGDPRKLSAEQRSRYRQWSALARRNADEARLRDVPAGLGRVWRAVRRRLGRLAANQHGQPHRRNCGRFPAGIARFPTPRVCRSTCSREGICNPPRSRR